jgi:galactose mutarotase-like enzyme
MHGTCNALGGWDVALLEIDEGGDAVLLEGTLDFGARPDLMATFPFAHRLAVRWEVLGAGHPEGEDEPVVRVTTTVAPTGTDAVPICFGWHPYLCLPGVPRDDWRLVLPEREHLLLDERFLPTGEVVEERAEAERLAGRTFDDAYRLGSDRTLAIEAGDRRTEITFDEGYPCAQVYAPGDAPVVAIEPMAAPAGALATGEHPWAEPGGAFDATFTVRVR